MPCLLTFKASMYLRTDGVAFPSSNLVSLIVHPNGGRYVLLSTQGIEKADKRQEFSENMVAYPNLHELVFHAGNSISKSYLSQKHRI